VSEILCFRAPANNWLLFSNRRQAVFTGAPHISKKQPDTGFDFNDDGKINPFEKKYTMKKNISQRLYWRAIKGLFKKQFFCGLFLLSVVPLAAQEHELHPDSVPVYHDTLYYKLEKEIKLKDVGLVNTSAIKNADLETLFSADFINGFISQNNITATGQSYSAQLPQVTGSYAGNNTNINATLTVVKTGTTTLRLPERTLSGVNCYQVNQTRRFDEVPYIREEVKVLYFASDNMEPLAWFMELYLYDEAINVFNYMHALVIPGPISSITQQESYEELKNLVKLTCSPNPAGNATSVTYHLPYLASVHLLISGTDGGVTVIETALKPAGDYNIPVNLSGKLPGIYTVRLKINSVEIGTQLIHN
jgi:hypothetical protein